eukprot:CAMPEP_0177589730 /NCGR_PEP_ID=MMETSP0419_2-20121207/6985_1 /TAXON_ID=582737 /ORGANISM="Tetraselmis sp., Strain GSL018" /LENGTH=454 /DNA_ID=CAMNT_0019080155 /DNA_START=246 /DNA_END=1611 /DNA_ORIENTATION=+
MYLLGANKRGGQLSTATEEEVSKYLSRFQLRRSSSDGSRNFSSRGRPTNYLLGKYLAVSRFCHSVVHQSAFGGFITSAIVVASLLVGIQTYPGMDYIPGREDNTRAGRILNILDQTVLAVFAAEIVLKIVAEGRRPWRFFASGGHGSHAAGHRRSEADPEEEMWNKSQMGSTRSAAVEPPPALRLRVDFWNVFDFAVVVVCYLPLGASMLAVIRLFRLLRVLKLLRVLPGLQILVIGLLTSLSSISYVVASAAAGLYLYGILFVILLRDNDPDRFGSLEVALMTLFRVATLEDWTEVMYTAIEGCRVYPTDVKGGRCTDPAPLGWLAAPLFVSFVMLSTFVVLNLFIGVVIKNMEIAKAKLDELLKDEALKRLDGEAARDLKELRQLSKRIKKLHTRALRLEHGMQTTEYDMQLLMTRLEQRSRQYEVTSDKTVVEKPSRDRLRLLLRVVRLRS